VCGARNGLPHSLLHYLGGQVLGPTLSTEAVAALQPRHHVGGQNNEANFTFFCSRRGLLATWPGSRGGGGGDWLERVYDSGLSEHLILIPIVHPLVQLLFVPFEMVQQYSCGGSRDLYNIVDFSYGIYHVLYNFFCRQNFIWIFVYINLPFSGIVSFHFHRKIDFISRAFVSRVDVIVGSIFLRVHF